MPKSGDPTGTAGGEYPWACPSVCNVNDFEYLLRMRQSITILIIGILELLFYPNLSSPNNIHMQASVTEYS